MTLIASRWPRGPRGMPASVFRSQPSSSRVASLEPVFSHEFDDRFIMCYVVRAEKISGARRKKCRDGCQRRHLQDFPHRLTVVSAPVIVYLF